MWIRRITHALRVGLLMVGTVFMGKGKLKATEGGRVGLVRQRLEARLRRELDLGHFRLGDPVFVRIFKESRELEVWIKPQGGEEFQLWKTFPIAAMSGTLGPKVQQGDGQAPEGFYTVDARALNPQSAYHLAFNVGYPNRYDREHGHNGSLIMVHGSNKSIGCFAMTDPVIEEIYLVAEAALQAGQAEFPVHVFPFRMTRERMEQMQGSKWAPFWENLRVGYKRFELTHLPPEVKVEDGCYIFG